MRKTIALIFILSILMTGFVSCNSNNDLSESNKNNTEQSDEIVFTDEELTNFKKTYEQLGSLFRELENKYENVSDEEKSKVKEDYERLKNEQKVKEDERRKANEEAQKLLAEQEKKRNEEKSKNEEKQNTEQIERKNIIGTSNKDFRNISDSSPREVLNDKTGKWKLSRISSTENILEYAKSYYKSNFNNDKEIHAIVNFTLNKTVKISKLFDNVISVTIHEYIDKEELDANKLFSGNVLGEYWIYLDNGDIEEIK
ncbi:hypothetical protein [Clostridium tertium]|uniref:hypothetical protein n=1 Tax=Clostridium tertium TaxID=1559 RepID=UPI000C074143|nr:hypothetical protein [Clostridium tertium]